MKLHFLMPVVLALLSSCPGHSQQVVNNICMEVVGSYGLSAQKLGRKYDATLGETMISTLKSSDGSYTLTQGFHQPECSKVKVSTYEAALDWEIEIYPNPVAHQFRLAYAHPKGTELHTRLWSISGRLVFDWRQTPSESVTDVGQLTAGVYFLEILDPETGAKTTARLVKITH